MRFFRYLSVLAIPALTFAGGVNMPWNIGLKSIADNVTGPTALGLVTIGAAATFGPLIFRGEVPEFAHRATYMSLVGGSLLAIPSLITFFGVSGALV